MRSAGGRSGSRLRYLWITLAVIAAALIVIFTVFRIRETRVVGNSRYSAQQITSDLIYDQLTRNSLWLSWEYRTASSEERTPYLNSVQVRLASPGSVVITVSEKKLIGRIQYSGQNVYFDDDGMVLEMTDQVYDDVTLVTGITCDAPVLYQRLPVSNTALLRTMLSICQLMNESGLQVDSVEFDDNLNITAVIGSVEVELGQDEYLEEKVSNLKTIYPQVENQSGTLNMSAFTGKNEAITFRQNEEPETEETETEDSGSSGSNELVGIDADQSGDEGAAGSDTSENGDSGTDSSGSDSSEAGTSDDSSDNSGTYGLDAFMVFDSSGTLRYDAHVVNGQVVDAYGNLIDGCYVNDDGNVVDAYWNVIDPNTGTLAQ